ncbi:MAG TPA: biotin/lipoate A/B protein ligase family protein [Oculatellaceae cyanobacterium]|jgi:lipoate-protein ligase A
MNVWRLIPLIEASGSIQMAIDEWLLEQHRLGTHPPTLRFYTWHPAAISLGYHQRQYPEFWDNLTWQGTKLDLVRRPTGGRAVLHQDDLTYAVITSGLQGTRLQVYEQICEFLIQGWKELGLDLHYGSAGRGYIHNPNCFGTATGADLVLADGSKFIGSAQLRRGNAVLQHGSMRLTQDTTLFSKVFETEVTEPIKIPLLQQSNALIETIVNTLTVAASNCFNIDIVVQPLSEQEWNLIVGAKK